jgi:hypothetical protein
MSPVFDYLRPGLPAGLPHVVGAVHARVSVDFAREFRCLIEAALA